MKTHLNIGSGQKPKSLPNNEWEDLDVRENIKCECEIYTPDIVADCRKIPREDNTYSFVYAHSVLEHFAKHERMDCLKEWYRVCKNGGRIWISVPDIKLIAKSIASGINVERALWFTYGNQDYPENQHKWGYTQESIKRDLIEVGFKNVKFGKPKSYEMELIVEATK